MFNYDDDDDDPAYRLALHLSKTDTKVDTKAEERSEYPIERSANANA